MEVGIIVVIVIFAAVLLIVFGRMARSGPSGEAVAALKARGARVVDVRSSDEFASGHVAGAVNVPVDTIVQKPASVGKKDVPVLVYCRSGARSARAASALQAAGYEVLDLGGYGAAKAALGG
jgi:phage shock protein E